MPAPSIDEMYRLLRTTRAFSDAFYLSANPDVAAAGLDPLLHYLEFGHRERRRPTPNFDPGRYLDENPDVAEAGVEPFFHFVFAGFREGRRVPAAGTAPPATEPPPSARFDPAFYLRENADVAAAGLDPEWHFRTFGEGEGRRPNAGFDPRAYARLHPDVAAAGVGLFEHFRTIGWREGRVAAATGARRAYKSDRHILFIGHDAIQAGAQTVLLETVRWFADHTDLNVTVLLCDVGPLTGAYADHADVVVLHNYIFDVGRVAHLLAIRWECIYANTVRTGAVARQLMAALHRKAPLVAHLHEFGAVLAGFEREVGDLLAVADRFIVVDEAIAGILATRGVTQARIAVEPPFIRACVPAGDRAAAQAMRDAARKTLGVADDTALVIGCGTAYERKGIDLFVETGLALRARTGGAPIRFAWIGDGAELDGARHRVRAAGAEPWFVFTGHRADGSRLIAGADLFFLSSREDPFPLVCLEAAQFGIPIVHFDRGTGIGAFVRGDAKRAAGAAIPAFSPQAAADRILALVDDPARRGILGENGRGRLFAAYEAEAKLGRLFQVLVGFGFLRPSVTVVVPNYNHAPYLDARLRSVLDQTLKSLQVVVLDDASTDASALVVEQYLADPRVSFHPSACNSGSPFAQWAKGVALAEADIVWIAESDDLADPGFCRALIGAFADPMVTIAAGRCEIINPTGEVVPGALAPWYDGAETDLFTGAWIRDGIVFIRSHFGARCTLVNASALLLRKTALVAALDGAATFRMCGDWLVYLRMLVGGKIAFSETAVSFFRRHATSAVHAIEGTPTYFRERAVIAAWVLDHAHLSATEVRRLVGELRGEWDRFAHKNAGDAFDRYFDARAIAAKARHRRGIVGLYVHGMLFSKGGIERLAAQLAQALVAVGYEVVLYCAPRGTAPPVYPLLESVAVTGVAIDGAGGVDRLADRLRRDRVDVFVPMLSERLFEPAIAAGMKAGVRILASEHNDPWRIEALWWSREARARTFAGADRIHLLLPAYVASLPDALRSRAVVIPNGIALDEADRPARGDARRIVCVARLAAQKRLDLLVESFAMVARVRPDWTLTILGDGELESALRAQVDALGLSERVSLPGRTEDVDAVLRESGIFVLPSAFEGFGIVVLEAQRAGLPCVAFRSCNGPNVLITHERDGLLVEPFGATALAAALLRLVDDDALRARLGRAGRTAVSAYALEGVMTRWIDTLDQLIAEAR